MRAQRIVPVGSDLNSAALPVGQIRSVRIDNPSGQWLRLFPTYDFIPPYTIGFARTFATTVQTITVRRNTPAGQVGTQAGDPVTIWIDSDPAPADSDGMPFIEEFTPILVASLFPIVLATNGFNGVLLTGLANRRFRLLTISMYLAVSINWSGSLGGVTGPGPVYIGDCGVLVGVLDDLASPTVALYTRLERGRTADHRSFPGGIDFAVGRGIFVSAATDGWATVAVNLAVSYQVI